MSVFVQAVALARKKKHEEAEKEREEIRKDREAKAKFIELAQQVHDMLKEFEQPGLPFRIKQWGTLTPNEASRDVKFAIASIHEPNNLLTVQLRYCAEVPDIFLSSKKEVGERQETGKRKRTIDGQLYWLKQRVAEEMANHLGPYLGDIDV